MSAYIRYNANGETPMEFVNLADTVPKNEVWDELKKTMSHHGEGRITFARSTYNLWCSDGKRYKVEILFDEDGLHKKLLPNHRFNAMVDLGRFTSKKFNFIGQSRNQDIKESWGSNYFVGDVIVKVTAGRPIPDISIFGDNPIKSILKKKTPNARMESKHGVQESVVMFSAVYKKELGHGLLLRDAGVETWEWVDYWIFPEDCENQEYIDLLKGWGINIPTSGQ